MIATNQGSLFNRYELKFLLEKYPKVRSNSYALNDIISDLEEKLLTSTLLFLKEESFDFEDTLKYILN